MSWIVIVTSVVGAIAGFVIGFNSAVKKVKSQAEKYIKNEEGKSE
jgi:uncharacterized protein YneF (UPF0154 family)